MPLNYTDGGSSAGVAKAAKAFGPEISVIYRQVDELKPDPKNPRAHAVKQVRQIANSIRQFGFVCPILMDAGGNIIAGHGRLQAAR